MELGTPLDPDQAALFEAEVAPRCRLLFEDRLLEMASPVDEEGAAVHLICRTGFHDEAMRERLGVGSLVGVDASGAAVEVALGRASVSQGRLLYQVDEGLPSSLPEESYSHVLSMYSLAMQGGGWPRLAEEAARLLSPGGQFLLAVPMRGSYQELNDLVSEYALQRGHTALKLQAEQAAKARPNPELLSDRLEAMGFQDVDVVPHRLALEYGSSEEFWDDALTRLLLEPQLRLLFGLEEPESLLDHVRRALTLYWRGMSFGLTLNLGCVSARR